MHKKLKCLGLSSTPFLDKLKVACDESDHQEIRRLFLTAPTAFSPTDGICDLNWKQKFNNQTNVTILPNVSGS